MNSKRSKAEDGEQYSESDRGMVSTARKARKILTEFDLLDGKKLRIDVIIWGNKEYAQKKGYSGNVVYLPLILDGSGSAKRIYPWRKGLPTLNDLEDFFDQWKKMLLDGKERRRLKELSIALRELADESTFFDSRQAHVVYKLLQIARREPKFTINKLRDIEKLSAEMKPALVIEFCGFRFVRAIDGVEYDTPVYNMQKSMNNINEKIETYLSDIRDDLALFVREARKEGSKEFPKISLNVIADEVEKRVLDNTY